MCGNRGHAMTPEYPDNCVQALCTAWWKQIEKARRQPWCLAEALVRHTSEVPYVLERGERCKEHSGDHSVAYYRLTALDKTNSAPEESNLPIAAIPHTPGERLMLHRGKRRPVLILAGPGTAVEEHLRENSSKQKFCPVYLVAPFYSADSGGVREGFKPAFVDRVKALCYTQFFWDHLPHKNGHASILRLDHIQPVEPASCNLTALPWKLSEEAQEFMREALYLHLNGTPPEPNGIWDTARKLLANFPVATLKIESQG